MTTLSRGKGHLSDHADTDVATRRRIRALIAGIVGNDLNGMLLFGSRARGDATPDSDWDVAVLVAEGADKKSIAKRLMLSVCSDWDDGTIVSPVVLTRSDLARSPSLAMNIHEDGVPV